MNVYQDDLDLVLQRAADNRVLGIVTIGTDLASSLRALHLAETYSMLRVAIGVHPHDVKLIEEDDLGKLAVTCRKT